MHSHAAYGGFDATHGHADVHERDAEGFVRVSSGKDRRDDAPSTPAKGRVGWEDRVVLLMVCHAGDGLPCSTWLITRSSRQRPGRAGQGLPIGAGWLRLLAAGWAGSGWQ